MILLQLVLVITGIYSAQAQSICSYSQLTAGGREQVLTSPGYPREYSNSITCSSLIRIGGAGCSIKFRVHMFSTENCCDRLVITDAEEDTTVATWKGSVNPGTEIVVSSREARLTFTTDGSVTASGFRISFKSDTSTTGGGHLEGGAGNICAVTSTSIGMSPRFFISPNYGNASYPSNLDCSVSICAAGPNIIRFKMHKMNLGEKEDVVQIKNMNQTEIYTKFKGSERIEPFYLPGGNYVLNLRTYPRVNDTDGILGFNLSAMYFEYKQTVNTCESDTVNLLASESPRYINSPGFPHRQYNNSLRCSWLISTNDERHSLLRISIHNITLEKDFDFLRIYDGDSTEGKLMKSFTGSPNTEFPIISSGPDLFLVFTTDLKNAHDGFNMSYSKVLTIPNFSDVYNTTISDEESTITVHFSSYFSVQNVKWYKNGFPIEEGENYQIKTEEIKIENSEANNYESTLTINATEALAVGVYRVSVKNERGYSDLSIMLNKRQYLPIFTNTEKKVTTQSASIHVKFKSNPAYDVIEIFTINEQSKMQVTNNSSPMPDAGIVYWIVTPSSNALDNDQYQLVVYLTNVRMLLSKTWFQLSIINSAGKSSVDVMMGYPSEAIPILAENIDATIKNGIAEIGIVFYSMLTPSNVTFLKNDIELTSSNKYSIDHVYNGSEIVMLPELYSFGFRNANSWNASLTELTPDQFQGMHVFREAYVLKIESLEATDFGTYTVIVENSAGKAQSTTELHQPPVFPSKQSCNQFKDVSLTCTIESCTDHHIFWIHKSFFGDTHIRYLEGSQMGNRNELKIHAAQHIDSGLYTCSVTRNKDINFISSLSLNFSQEPYDLEEIHGGNVYLQVNAVPTVSKMIVHYENDGGISVMVDFSCNPRYTLIHWYQNGKEINTLSSNGYKMTTSPKYVTHLFYGKQVVVPGYSSELLVRNNGHSINNIFGLYKVSIENQFGHTIYFLNVQNQNKEAPLFNLTSAQTMCGEGYCEISIQVFSNPAPIKTVWMHKNSSDVTSDNRFNVEIIPLNESQNIYLAKMTIRNINVDDYNLYFIKVDNDVGSSQRTIDLSKPEEALPSMTSDFRITLTNTTALIEASFISGPLQSPVFWLKNYDILKASDKYNMNLEKSNLNRGSYVATLVIVGLTEGDMGFYQIVMRNQNGQTIKSFALNRACDHEN